MSIATAITNAQGKVADAYTAISNKGGTLPATQNLSNMPTAISSIPTSGGGTITSLSVTPTTSQQTITASGGVDGYSPITVSAVTSSIDNNIVAGNIKNGVTILGVQGTYAGGGITPTGTISITQNGTYNVTNYASADVNVSGGGSFVGIQREVSQSGVYQMPTSDFTFSLPNGATNIGASALIYAFSGCKSITSANLSTLTSVSGSSAMQYAFNGCSNLTSVDLSNLTIVNGNSAMYNAFSRTGLSSVDLSSLTTVSGSSTMRSAFDGCQNLISIDLSGLTTLSGTFSAYFILYNCKNLTSVDLSSLTTLTGSNAMGSAFASCTSLTSLSFPSLTSTSFGNYTDQFNTMLSGVTGCTVHFPSNLQSVIGSWSSVTNGFGGTNTVVLFNLPATT